jgi:hypothetical protein
MSKCNLDHTNHEVMTKLQSQREALPESLFESLSVYLLNRPSQSELNELFHFLKKYDLSTSEEREARDIGMSKLSSKSEH